MTARALALTWLVLLGGCAGRWAELRDRETRTGESYTDLKLHLDVQATRLTPEAAVARVNALCLDRQCLDTERQKLEAGARAHSERQTRFVLVVYTREPAWNDLDRPDSKWRVHLEADGQRRLPDEIRKVKRKRHVYERLFPALDGFREAYEVHFPAAAGPTGSPEHLVVTGVLGTVSLTWGPK